MADLTSTTTMHVTVDPRLLDGLDRVTKALEATTLPGESLEGLTQAIEALLHLTKVVVTELHDGPAAASVSPLGVPQGDACASSTLLVGDHENPLQSI